MPTMASFTLMSRGVGLSLGYAVPGSAWPVSAVSYKVGGQLRFLLCLVLEKIDDIGIKYEGITIHLTLSKLLDRQPLDPSPQRI